MKSGSTNAPVSSDDLEKRNRAEAEFSSSSLNVWRGAGVRLNARKTVLSNPTEFVRTDLKASRLNSVCFRTVWCFEEKE